MANRRISRTKNFASYVNALNQDVSTLKNLDAGGSISARSISGDSLADTVTLFGNSIQSSNYAAGAAGWKIDGSGVAEFEDVYVRGDINAETGTIGFWNISPVDATRYIGPKKIFGTFLESADVGINDNDKEDGVYVSLFKSYFEDALPIINARRVSNVATITVPGHTYEPGDYVQVRVNEDSTFNAYPFAALILETTSETFTYSNPGANFPAPDAVTGIIPSTQVTGTAQYYQDDVAGLFVRDYAKVKFDYGYFSSDGIKFATGETVNIVRNPSFELGTGNWSSSSWDLSYATGGDWVAPQVTGFEYLSNAWNFAGHSYSAASFTWTSSPYDNATDYILGTIDFAGADRFNLFDESVDRTLYYNMDVFFQESLQDIPLDSAGVPIFSTTEVTIPVTGFNRTISYALSNATVATYTMATPGTAPAVGSKVTISGMSTGTLDKTDVTVSSSTGDSFTVTGTGFTTVSNTAQTGDVLSSWLNIGDVIHTGQLSVTGRSPNDSVSITHASSTVDTATYVVSPVTSVPPVGSKVTIVGIPSPASFNQMDVTVETANTTSGRFTVLGDYAVVANAARAGTAYWSDGSGAVQEYAEAPTGERYFTVTSLPTANSFSITNYLGIVPATEQILVGSSVYRPMRGSAVTSVSLPGEDFLSTTSSTSTTAATGSKTFNTSYTGSYLVNHRVSIYGVSTTDDTILCYLEGVVTAVTANTSIVVNVHDLSGDTGTFNSWTFSIVTDDFNNTTSATSLSISTGSKVFTLAAGVGVKTSGSYFVGFRAKAYRESDPTTYMEGYITAISANSTITLNVDTVGGSGGPYTDWVFEWVSGGYLDLTLTFSGGHDFVEGDNLYLDFSTLGSDGFDYTDSYSGVGMFEVIEIVSNTVLKTNPWNYNPDTSITAATPTPFLNSTGFARPAAAYAVSNPYSYEYSLAQVKLQFSNNTTKKIVDILTPAGASSWGSGGSSASVSSHQYVYQVLTSTSGISRLPIAPVEISSLKLLDAYKTLDPDGFLAGSNISLRVPVGVSGSGLSPLLSVSNFPATSYMSTVLDNIGLTTGVEFFFGGGISLQGVWGDTLSAPNTYSVGSADVWIDVSVPNETSSLDHTSSIGFKSTTSNVLLFPASITAADSRYSSRPGLVYDNQDSGGWIFNSPIPSPSFGKNIYDNNIQAEVLSDYSVITFSSGEYISRELGGGYKYTGSSLTSYTSDLFTGTEMIAYKQSVDSLADVSANKVASVGVWVDDFDTAYATTVADYTEFRSVDGTKRTLTAGYVYSNTGSLKKKRLAVDPDAEVVNYRTVSDPLTAPHVLYRKTGTSSTTTNATANPGTVPLAGYFRTGASGLSLINYGARVDHSAAGGGAGISMRVRLGTDATGDVTTTGTIQSLTVPEVLSSGDFARTDSGATVFVGRPHTTYYAEFLLYADTAGTATALDRHFTITPIV